MLNRLSAHYQKEIALSLLCLFFIAGLGSVKANVLRGKMPVNAGVNALATRSKSLAGIIPLNRAGSANGISVIPVIVNAGVSLLKTEGIGKLLSYSQKIIPTENANAPLIGGPGQPEMAAFKAVGSDNMVNPFSGDFSYNIPLLDVGGYPVNMFYQSGITMDQEASWVGLGWNINPGTINRNMRGVPDDFDGSDVITKTQSVKPDKTWGVSASADVKLAGFPFIGFGFSTGLSFNNKLGVATEAGIHPTLSISGKSGDNMTAGLSASANLNASARNGASITPSISLGVSQKNNENGNLSGSLGLSYSYSSRMGLTAMHLDAGVSRSRQEEIQHDDQSTKNISETVDFSGEQSLGTMSSSISFAYPSVMPSTRNVLTRKNYNFSVSAGGEIYSINIHGRIGGYYSESKIAEDDKVIRYPAYGMLNYQKANTVPGAMLDFNRANDGMYTPANPAIAMPVYTYDIFSINGEGTGGVFRATRNDMGYMRDPYVKTREDAASLGVDLGFGNILHAGVQFSYAYTPSTVTAWEVNNTARNVMGFKENDSTYQAVYFRNPGEKTIPDINYQNGIGGESLTRFKMANIASGTPMLLPNLVKYDAGMNKTGEITLTPNSFIRPGRDKRTQVISCLTAEESERIGFNRYIYSYNAQGIDSNKIIFSANCNKYGVDSFYRWSTGTHPAPQVHQGEGEDFRKKNHISEIDVLGTDGRKYIYGLPVYNTKQVDVSFSIDKSQGNTATSKVTYTDADSSRNNKKGRDNILEKQETPAYTHSYLLTELLSPNYVDVTGNGISEDDMGDAIKFNYSKFHNLKWRTPIGDKTATYSEGLKTDDKDDKAHYVYGERESWLLYSIESKNMVARFYTKDDRKDAREVVNEGGALNTGRGAQRLDHISLYSKGDLVKTAAPKPIKTIRFFQSYKLCKNSVSSSALGSSSIANEGKLTLDSIWITYNGNQKKAKSRYIFSYPASNNPDYNFNANDRWGNYKPETDGSTNNNIGGLGNCDFPYAVQDKTKADKYAAAWTMNKIVLPSGAIINVDYEADTYSYVQNRRATSMFEISGFGSTDAPTAPQRVNPYLYTTGVDFDWVYIKLPYAVTNTNAADAQRELTARYFDNVKQLYMKLMVIMPDKSGIPESEQIPVYADIERYGLVAGTGGTMAYVKVQKVAGGMNPMIQQALQFIKQQLPGKAYKGYDVSEESGIQAIVTSLAGMVSSVQSLLVGDDEALKRNNKCKEVQVSKSFARLTDPYLAKNGGGLRVKRVTINDNWNKMTGQYEASYGQEYKYTTKELVNGRLTDISSGVASWEPSIGADENPHKEIMRYMNHNKGGPFDFGAVELPLGEMFYPSPSVGYSRVEVLSIHRDTVKNLPTRQVTEFYTTRDFPYKSSATLLTDPEANVKYEPSQIMQLLKLDMKKAITQSQGFLVEINDMSGKEKQQSTYSALDSINPVASTRNYYNITQATDKTYSFNHTFMTIDSADGKIHNSVIGRDIELMSDFRQHKTETISKNINLNLDFFILGWFPIPLFNPVQPVIRESTTYRSASLLKVVNHYGMLDSVVVIDKGSMVSTKNLVYDAETGNVLLTRTENEHNRPIYNFSYPAHWVYSGMGPAYKNIDALYKGLNFHHGKLLNPPANKNIFESGDEIYVLSQNDRVAALAPCDNSAGTDPWTSLQKNTAKKIWAVNTAKTGSNPGAMVFMDAEGYPYNADNTSIRIIRSGHRNMLDQMVGSITSLSSPVRSNKLVFNDTTNIIQTGAATFRDHWRVDNSFYWYDSSSIVNSLARIKVAHFGATQSGKVQAYVDDGSVVAIETVTPNPAALTARSVSLNSPQSVNSDAWLDFSMRGHLPSGLANTSATIIKTGISLYSHTATNMGSGTQVYDHGFGNYGLNHGSTASHLDRASAFNGVNLLVMRTAWPTNTAGWSQLFIDQNRNLHDWSAGGTIAPTPWNTTIAKDYILQGGHDDRAIINSGAMNEMLTYARNGSSAVATGFRLMQSRYSPGTEKTNRKEDISQCFAGVCAGSVESFGSGGDSSALVTCLQRSSPQMSVYYYNCGDTTSSGGPDPDTLFNKIIVCGQHVQYIAECRSKFTRKAINPYVEGILGNWRVDSTYAYYGTRKEADPATAVDTRTGGTISNFKTFWNFSSTAYLTRNAAASDVWVWNSTITQYNRKGYEIENKDPLGRFNSGLYGYNQQLPVAVANNARVREIMFDGYEDYDYQTSGDCITCKPHRQFNYDSTVITKLDSTQQHTGRYSLKLTAGQHIALQAPVTNIAVADSGYQLRVKMDSTLLGADTTVLLQGLGWTAKWANFYGGSGWTYPSPDAAFTIPYMQRDELEVNLQCSDDSHCSYGPPTGLPMKFARARWVGYLQPKASGTYYLQTYADDGIRVKVDAGTVIYRWDEHPATNTSGAITMLKGGLYKIQVDWFQAKGAASALLLWKTPGTTSFTTIPSQQVYRNIADTAGTVNTTGSAYCTRLDSVNVRGNALTDTFSLVQGKKMLLSAWVKENTTDCKCSTYVNNSVVLSYTGSSETVTLHPAGSIIEGWQRYEAVFIIPVTATKIKVNLGNTGSVPAYFDDVRIHPFNANLKSFVYHSSTLRLMAELDENNYASFYEYDDDGTLTRVKKETIKGIKTITETRSAMQKIINE